MDLHEAEHGDWPDELGPSLAQLPRGPSREGYVGEGRGATKATVFLECFLKAERRIFAYIFTMLPNRADADDVLQQVSLLMWEKFDVADPPRDLVKRGCRIAYFVVMDHRRSRRRGRLIFSDELIERIGMTAEYADDLRLDDRREALTTCLAKLRAEDRLLLEERLKKNATVQSAAAIVGRSVDAVYKALARIRRLLHTCIEQTLGSEGR